MLSRVLRHVKFRYKFFFHDLSSLYAIIRCSCWIDS
uniref:Uncharacterized protein n=1 Tax=Arundo donax TaxID=35708 RepID=A0A0A8YJ80_ARUDO